MRPVDDRAANPRPGQRPILGRAWRRLRRALRRRPPQLLMRYRGRAAPAASPLPPGYVLRTARPGDHEAWIALLNANAELGRWNEARLGRETAGAVGGAVLFVVHGDDLVATAGVYDRAIRGRAVWEIGWVARHPAHREMGLGIHSTAAAVAAARALPKRPVVLLTDDRRVSAISGYLAMGFEPDIKGHRSYARRWAAVRARIASRGPAP